MTIQWYNGRILWAGNGPKIAFDAACCCNKCARICADGQAPEQLQVTLSGVQPGQNQNPCTHCPEYNDVFVVDWQGHGAYGCGWYWHDSDCAWCAPAEIYVWLDDDRDWQNNPLPAGDYALWASVWWCGELIQPLAYFQNIYHAKPDCKSWNQEELALVWRRTQPCDATAARLWISSL
jgi:hypothetical protein